MSNIEEKFKRLKTRIGLYDDASKQNILAWEERINRYLLMSSAKENDGIKKIIEKYKSDLNTINELLLNDESLIKNGEERRWIFERKRWITEFLNLFNDNGIQNIEKQIDQELNYKYD